MQNDASIQLDEDVGLMVKAQEGDRQAYARVYEKYAPVVTRYVAAHDGRAGPPEDSVQEVFTRVWEHRGRYRPGMAVCPYLLGFARNVCREHQTYACRATRTKPPELGPVEGNGDLGPDVVAVRNDLADWVRFHLAKLPPKQRQALELVYLAQIPTAEAARVLHCSRKALRQNLCAARQRLATMLVLAGEEIG